MTIDGEYASGRPEPGHEDQNVPIVGDSQRVAALEAELAQMRDRWMRAEAEIANLGVRAKRELDEVRQYGTHKFSADVVEVAENLQRA